MKINARKKMNLVSDSVQISQDTIAVCYSLNVEHFKDASTFLISTVSTKH